MFCCGQCFSDRGLCGKIIPQLPGKLGDCPSCQSKEQYLVDARSLWEYFGPLCAIYTKNTGGKLLIDWLIDDWQIFAIDRAAANDLLVEILDDGERVRQKVVPSELCLSDRLNRWELLRDELRHQNRFFPKTAFEQERVEELLSYVMFDGQDQPEKWYRARINTSGKPCSSVEMGPPPKEISTHGRASPAGIPYLYLGSTPVTAVAEVRPHPGEKVCVAEFAIESGLQIVDLRNPRQRVSPFLLGDERAIAMMRGDIEFLERWGQELTTPVLPNAAAIDYIPSQYLCEFIKKCNYLGVVYSSSVSDGINLALFDPDKALVGNLSEYAVDKVSVEISRR